MVFKPGNWVWVHFRKIRFPDMAKSKLTPRGDGPFLVLECLNDNAYVIDLPGEYKVSCTFNVADLSPYDCVGEGPDLRTNPFQEGEDDTIMEPEPEKHVSPNPLKALGRPTTRSMTRKELEGLIVLIRKLLDEEEARPKLGEGVQRPYPGWVVEHHIHPGRVNLLPKAWASPGMTPGPGGFQAIPPGQVYAQGESAPGGSPRPGDLCFTSTRAGSQGARVFPGLPPRPGDSYT